MTLSFAAHIRPLRASGSPKHGRVMSAATPAS